MILTTGRILEITLAANMSDTNRGQRREQVTQMPPGKRHLAGALLGFAEKHTVSAEAVLDKIAQRKGLSYLGAGFDFSVYGVMGTDQVVKNHRRSADMPPVQRHALVEGYEAGQNDLRLFLGDMVVSAEAYVGEHVLGGGHQTFQVTQQRVACPEEASPFVPRNPEIDLKRLDAIVRDIPGSDVAYGELVDMSRTMYETTEKLPDTNGSCNFATQPDGSLLLVDAVPIGSNWTDTQSLILSQLNSLESGLLEVCG